MKYFCNGKQSVCDTTIPCEECDYKNDQGGRWVDEKPTMKVVLDEDAKMPSQAHTWDAGFDLYSRENAIIFPGHTYSFNTGVHVQIPRGYGGLLVSKSGLSDRYSVQSDGLIDADYTGAIKVKLYNHGHAAVRIEKGQKISQLVIVPVLIPKPEQVDSLEETERGNGGFGSTGKF